MRGTILESYRKGDLTEAIVIAEFKERNIPVSKPFGDNERYDLLADVPDGDILRIQVKTGRYENGVITFDGWSQRSNTSGNRYVSYRGDIDYFVVYCDRFESLYLVDADMVNSGLNLRVDEPAIKHPSINWARDFEFDRCWPSSSVSHTDPTREQRDLPPNRRGDATEARVIAELLERGVSIATPPTDNERFDLILGTPAGEHYKVQVKTGWMRSGCVTFRAASSHVNAEGIVRKPYDHEIDYFLVYSPIQEEMYLIPREAVNAAMYLRVDESKRSDRTANHASEYLFDRNWPPDDPTVSGHGGPRPLHREVGDVAREAFSDLDCIIAEPLDDAPYDLLVETSDGNLVRCLVRSAQTRNGRIFFHPDDPPDAEAFDYYLLYGYDTDQLYLLHPSLFDSSITLWVDDPKQVRHTTTRAADYELNRQWPPSSSSRIRISILRKTAVEFLDDLGANIAYPPRDAPFDLWVESDDNRFQTLAIEPGWITDGRIRLKPDSKDGIDQFLLVCRELETCYLVRAEEFNVSISLRIDTPDHDDGTVRYAEDYELATRWPSESDEDESAGSKEN